MLDVPLSQLKERPPCIVETTDVAPKATVDFY